MTAQRPAWPVAAGLLGGWAADIVLGDPRRAHPVALFGRTMTALETRVWRDARGPGAAYAVAGVVLGAGPVLVLDRRWRAAPVRRAALTAAVTWAALGGRSLAGAGEELGRRVADGDLDGARALAPTLVGRDPATLDGAGLSRAGLESVAENTSDAIVAPLLWGALLGAPGVALHRALNTMDAMVGHRSPRYARFGWASARADDVAGWPAARTGAALTVLAAAWPGTRGDGGAPADGPRAAPGQADEAAAGAAAGGAAAGDRETAGGAAGGAAAGDGETAGGARPTGREAVPGQADEEPAGGGRPAGRRAAAEPTDDPALRGPRLDDGRAGVDPHAAGSGEPRPDDERPATHPHADPAPGGPCPDDRRSGAHPHDDPAPNEPRPDDGRADAHPHDDPAAGGPRSALRAWWRDGAAHPSPNAGRVEAAFAGALGVRLGGRNVYGGRVEERPLLHAEGRAPGPADLRRAAALSRHVGALAAVAAAGTALLLRHR